MSSARSPRALARTLALALLAALLTLFVVWHAARFSARTALLAGTLAVLPWLPVIPGLYRRRAKTQVLALLLTTPYLGYGLMEVLANPGARVYAAATVFLAFALALALVANLRLNRPAAAIPP
jgi:uncharacterized membrane protein